MSRPTGIVLPRPNLGPEPLATDAGLEWGRIMPILAALLIFAGVLIWMRRRRFRPNPPPDAPASASASAEATLEGRLRERLSLRLGEAWTNLTSEEMAGSSRAVDALGRDAADRLLGYFQKLDRIKYSGREEDLTEEEAWVVHFLEFEGAAGPSSMMKG